MGWDGMGWDGQLALNSALGFDTFLVMRHGAAPLTSAQPGLAIPPSPASRLGCYFCNDVVAPLDVSANRKTNDRMIG